MSKFTSDDPTLGSWPWILIVTLPFLPREIAARRPPILVLDLTQHDKSVIPSTSCTARFLSFYYRGNSRLCTLLSRGVHAQGVAKSWLESQPRTRIETDEPGYLHAKSLSLLFGFPDSVGVSISAIVVLKVFVTAVFVFLEFWSWRIALKLPCLTHSHTLTHPAVVISVSQRARTYVRETRLLARDKQTYLVGVHKRVPPTSDRESVCDQHCT